MDQLIKKYDKPGPRYTSYPPVPFWNGEICEYSWPFEIQRQFKNSNEIDLYIHIPYCEKLCYYCGCNRVVSKNKDRANTYVETLKKEWEFYLKRLDNDFVINSIHLGGGTPTFLPPQVMDDLLSVFAEYKSDKFIGAIEVDPRTCKEEHLDVLRSHGFCRVSMGIQDFNPLVQTLINRTQPFEMVYKLVNQIREKGFESINFDLIYGLPGQSLATIKDTIEKVKSLKPDLIAFYSYAHLPEKLKNQKLIPADKLPVGLEKRELYETGKELLAEIGYLEIGMDHFALETSYLAKVSKEKKLMRSFMGYTDKKSHTLIGLGASAIGNTDFMYVQNYREVSQYIDAVNTRGHALHHGHKLSELDQELNSFIQNIMCNDEAELSRFLIDQFTREHWVKLREMENDGLLAVRGNTITVTHLGKAFVRNIAMVFDPYLKKEQSTRFSRTI